MDIEYFHELEAPAPVTDYGLGALDVVVGGPTVQHGGDQQQTEEQKESDEAREAVMSHEHATGLSAFIW